VEGPEKSASLVGEISPVPIEQKARWSP